MHALMVNYLFIFAFVSFALGNRSKKKVTRLYFKDYSMFYSLGFMVSGLRFKSLIHFMFIF